MTVRSLDLLVLLAVAVVGARVRLRLARAAAAARMRQRAVPEQRWEAYHVSVGGRTEVGVRRPQPCADATGGPSPVVRREERRVVALVDDADPDYDDLFRTAMWDARRRAEVLQLESPVE